MPNREKGARKQSLTRKGVDLIKPKIESGDTWNVGDCVREIYSPSYLIDYLNTIAQLLKIRRGICAFIFLKQKLQHCSKFLHSPSYIRYILLTIASIYIFSFLHFRLNYLKLFVLHYQFCDFITAVAATIIIMCVSLIFSFEYRSLISTSLSN